MGIDPHWCLCVSEQEFVATSDDVAHKRVQNVIDYMNEKNEAEAKGYCQELALTMFVSASKQVLEHGVETHRLKFVTSPNNRLYEATISCNGKCSGHQQD